MQNGWKAALVGDVVNFVVKAFSHISVLKHSTGKQVACTPASVNLKGRDGVTKPVVLERGTRLSVGRCVGSGFDEGAVGGELARGGVGVGEQAVAAGDEAVEGGGVAGVQVGEG